MEHSRVRHAGSKSFSEEGVDVVNVPLHKGRTLIKQRPKSSLVLALPAAEVCSRELVTMAQSHLGNTGCITSTLLNLLADVVIAVGPCEKSLQLLHGHGEPPEGYSTANQT
tara:strand:- start:7111 stop:7443 length:333 start_codon:yes stop_codon:yes gene_type:complete